MNLNGAGPLQSLNGKDIALPIMAPSRTASSAGTQIRTNGGGDPAQMSYKDFSVGR